ncbi:hypothetical protein Taro_025992 [Colocasia esculenta]|uniref:Uncharacterized protein n=1 Tax=Colocasia esculenta TaxID=4460 RepID=A0A843VAA2_COLES|nr:hypothetical protein [Colocasia esculenta]
MAQGSFGLVNKYEARFAISDLGFVSGWSKRRDLEEISGDQDNIKVNKWILTTLPEEILTTIPDSSRPSCFSGRGRDRYSREISRESREIAYHGMKKKGEERELLKASKLQDIIFRNIKSETQRVGTTLAPGRDSGLTGVLAWWSPGPQWLGVLVREYREIHEQSEGVADDLDAGPVHLRHWSRPQSSQTKLEQGVRTKAGRAGNNMVGVQPPGSRRRGWSSEALGVTMPEVTTPGAVERSRASDAEEGRRGPAVRGVDAMKQGAAKRPRASVAMEGRREGGPTVGGGGTPKIEGLGVGVLPAIGAFEAGARRTTLGVEVVAGRGGPTTPEAPRGELT